MAGGVPGVPCSVLGIVLRDGVAVFDPIEIVTLRDRARSSLVFCGSSTWWRPAPAAVAEIRRYARLTGSELARAVDYRGMFSVDGILGDRGFVATELNPWSQVQSVTPQRNRSFSHPERDGPGHHLEEPLPARARPGASRARHLVGADRVQGRAAHHPASPRDA